MFFITIRSDVCGAIQALIAPKLFMPAWLLDNRQFEEKKRIISNDGDTCKDFLFTSYQLVLDEVSSIPVLAHVCLI